MILSQATDCMNLVFGIDVKALDPTGLFYVLVNTLGLTYNDSLRVMRRACPWLASL